MIETVMQEFMKKKSPSIPFNLWFDSFSSSLYEYFILQAFSAISIWKGILESAFIGVSYVVLTIRIRLQKKLLSNIYFYSDPDTFLLNTKIRIQTPFKIFTNLESRSGSFEGSVFLKVGIRSGSHPIRLVCKEIADR